MGIRFMFSSEDTIRLVELFRLSLAELSGKMHLVTKEKLPATVAEIIRNQQAKTVMGYNSAYLKSLQLKKSLENLTAPPLYWIPTFRPENFDEQLYRSQLASADLAITSADYLIAETATLIFRGKHNPSRLITLLPPALIVIVSIASLLPDLETFHSLLNATGSERDESLIYFSGPSRTADIEKILVLGVHGPKTLTVLVVENSER